MLPLALLVAAIVVLAPVFGGPGLRSDRVALSPDVTGIPSPKSSDTDSGLDTPDPSLCTITPREPLAFRTPGALPAVAPAEAPAVGSGFSWPRGATATSEETALIHAAIREFHACKNAGDYPRLLALYTTRYLAPRFAALDASGWQATLELAQSTPTPLPSVERETVVLLGEVRRLSDGRLGAFVAAVVPAGQPLEIDAVLIFAFEDGRWRIDESHADPTGLARPAPARAVAPTAGT